VTKNLSITVNITYLHALKIIKIYILKIDSEVEIFRKAYKTPIFTTHIHICEAGMV